MTSPFNRRGDVSWADSEGTALLRPDGGVVPLNGAYPGGAITGPASSRSMVIIGDSRMTGALSGAGSLRSAQCWTTWLNVLLGHPFDIVSNLAVAGERSDQYLTRLPDAMALRPGWIALWGVVNDISQGRTPLGSGAFWPAIEAAARACVARGTRVLLCGETGTYNFSAALTGRVLQYNQLCRELAEAVPGVVYLDFPSVTWDLTASVITHKPNYTSDATHFDVPGGLAQGRLAASVLRPLIWQPSHVLLGAVDVGANSGQMQYLPNAAFATASGGTVGANATGVAPAAWNISGSGTTVPVLSSVSGGEWQAAVTATGSGHVSQGMTFNPSGSAGAYPAPLSGEVHQAGAQVVVPAGSTGYIGSECELFMQIGGVNYSYVDCGSQNTNKATEWDSETVLTLMTPKFLIPSGSVTGWQFFVRHRFNSAGSVTLKLRGPWYRRRYLQ